MRYFFGFAQDNDKGAHMDMDVPHEEIHGESSCSRERVVQEGESFEDQATTHEGDVVRPQQIRPT